MLSLCRDLEELRITWHKITPSNYTINYKITRPERRVWIRYLEQLALPFFLVSAGVTSCRPYCTSIPTLPISEKPPIDTPRDLSAQHNDHSRIIRVTFRIAR